MAVFAISRSNSGFTASVDGADIGREVDAAKFHKPASLEKESTGLAKIFGDAVNDAQFEAQAAPVAERKIAAVKPQSFDA